VASVTTMSQASSAHSGKSTDPPSLLCFDRCTRCF
jgi:hypothetical protein